MRSKEHSMSNQATQTPILDAARFLGRLIATPRSVGAIAPSSPGLARAMAAQVDPAATGRVLELGPGTGVITQALLTRGLAPERIVAIEYDPDFAGLLTRRFPGVRVIRGDAFDLARTLSGENPEPFAAALSGLPLVNFPKALRQKVLESVFARLAPGAPFVQFSYSLWPPIPPPPQVTVKRMAFILWNLPPARVWVYRRN
jgi:phosphatidylethanolamine/phosphatidyl-N-methylethanolamine N-methyltransferase